MFRVGDRVESHRFPGWGIIDWIYPNRTKLYRVQVELWSEDDIKFISISASEMKIVTVYV